MKRSRSLLAFLAVVFGTALGVAMWTVPSAFSFSADDTSFYDGLSDLSAFDASQTSGVAVDAFGGMRLATNGSETVSTWDSMSDFSSGTAWGPVVGLKTLDATSSGGATGSAGATGAAGTLRLARAGLALSLDASNPVVGPSFFASETADTYEVAAPCVVKVTETYYAMFYSGVAADGYTMRALLATSSDGGHDDPWHRVRGPGRGGCVLDVGAAGAFDQFGIVRPAVTYDASATTSSPAWHMFYGGLGRYSGAVGSATSTDGVNWVKSTDASGRPAPAIESGGPGTEDGYLVGEPTVCYDAANSVFRMWYTAYPSWDVRGRQVGYATSGNTSETGYGARWDKGGIIDLTGGGGNFTGGWFSPGVWYEGSPTRRFIMSFAGRKMAGQAYKLLTAYPVSATSTVDWNASGAPQLNDPGSQAWEINNVFWQTVLKDTTPTATPYRVYYTGNGGAGDWARNAIGYELWNGANNEVARGKVLDRTEPNERFDSNRTANACVLPITATTTVEGTPTATPWTMFYAGRSGRDLQWRIGLAGSPDASRWYKKDGTGDASRSALFALGTAGSHDASGASAPSVVASAGLLHMFYEATSAVGVSSIGYASSTEASLTAWTRNAAAVFEKDSSGFDSDKVAHPSVAVVGGKLWMYYAGFNGARWEIGRAVATSAPGPWTRDVSACVTVGAAAQFDGGSARDPVVAYNATATPAFRMWYSAVDTAGIERICSADSTNGVTWTKRGLALAPSGDPYSFDEYGVRASGAAYDATRGVWHVYYDGVDRGNDGNSAECAVTHWQRIGHAVARASGSVPGGSAEYECVPTGTPAPNYKYEFRRFEHVGTEPSGTVARYEVSFYPAAKMKSGQIFQTWSPWFSVDSTPPLSLPLITEKVRWRVAMARETTVASTTPVLDTFRVAWAPVHFTTTGTAVSIPIRAAEGRYIASWQDFVVNVRDLGAETSASVKVLSEDGQVLTSMSLTNGTNQSSLATVPPGIAGVRVVFEISGDGLHTPYIENWKIGYTTTDVGPVQRFRTMGATSTVYLRWTQPTYSDYQKTRVLRKLGGFPTGPTDASAIVAYEASGTKGASMLVTQTGLVNGTFYYYAAYASDGASWSPAALAVGMPQPALANVSVVGTSTGAQVSWSKPTTYTGWYGTMVSRRSDTWPVEAWDASATKAAEGVKSNYFVDVGAGGTLYYTAYNDHAVVVNGFTYHAYSMPARPARVTRIIRVVKLEGIDRYATAIAMSRSTFGTGACGSVIIATGKNYPDALGAGGLAGVVRSPILLVRDSFDATTKAELRRLVSGRAAYTVYIIGGTGAVSSLIETSLRNQLVGETVVRLGGLDRYATAVLVAKRARLVNGAPMGKAFVVTGANFPDALVAAPQAYRNKWPILLTNNSPTVNTNVRNCLVAVGSTSAYVIGTPLAVTDLTKNTIDAGISGTVLRIASATTCYKQSVDVASWAVKNTGASYDRLAIATGETFPDALAAGPVEGEAGAVLFLTPRLTLDPNVRTALYTNRYAINEIRYCGGTGAVSPAVRTAVYAALQ